jgi:hypothetical protein
MRVYAFAASPVLAWTGGEPSFRWSAEFLKRS